MFTNVSTIDPNYLKINRAKDFSFFNFKGNNTTFDGGGSLAGLLNYSKTPSEVLTEKSVFKYSANGVNGQNDFFGYSLNLTNSFKGATRTLQFKIKSVNAIDSDISAHVKIVGGTRDGYVYNKLLKAASAATINSLAFDVPSDATSLKYGFKNNSTTTTLQFFVDDIALGYKAFDYVNNVQQETWLIESAQNAMTTLGDYQFPVSPTVLKNGVNSSQTDFALNSNIIYHDRSNAGQSRFYATKDCRVKIRIGSPNMGINSGVYIGHSGRSYLGGTSTSITGYFGEVNAVIFMKAGEYFHTGTATGTTSSTADILRLSIESTIVSDQIIQLGNSNNDWQVYTPTTQGFGTISNVNLYWKKDKSNLLIKGYFTAGIVTNDEARVGLPLSLLPLAGPTGLKTLVGQWGNDSASTNGVPRLIAETAKSYLMFTVGTSNYLTSANASGFIGNSVRISIDAVIPIQGWSDAPPIFSLPVSAQQDFYIEAAGNAGQVITANVTDIPFIATTQNNLTWDGSGFTAPISGNYEVSGFILGTAIQTSNQFNIYINGVVDKLLFANPASSSQWHFNYKGYLAAGQRLSIRSTGNTLTVSNNTISHYIKITRLNGKNDSVCVGEVAKNLIATIEYRGNGTRVTLTTTPIAMPLTTVKGESQIVSILSNQFTLQAGEFEVDWSFMHHFASGASATNHYIYNVTDGVEVNRGMPSYTNNLSAYLHLKGTPTRLSLASQKVFELRVLSNSGVNYIGDSFPAPNDMQGFIKVTKLLGV
jgi:hypothetical protein